MPRYMTPAKTAEAMNLPLWMLRTKIKRGEVPGFHHGNRYYINVDLFTQKLEEESRENMKQ